jgi:cellobiose-specific phosphotransferase system component IIB
MPDSVDMILVSPQSKYVYENLKAKIDKQILWLKDLAFSREKN